MLLHTIVIKQYITIHTLSSISDLIKTKPQSRPYCVYTEMSKNSYTMSMDFKNLS